MSQSRNVNQNAKRFSGFADIYDSARPAMPVRAVEAVEQYLERRPETVVDLGCGTGLSTAAWKGRCAQVIGVDPNGDMLEMAGRKAEDGVSLRQAYAHETGLPSRCADAVVCSQSFHWMEPESTLREVDRILKPGGVFATVDCDWPPVCGLTAEMAYAALFEKVRAIETGNADIRATFHRWEKSDHLRNIKGSGYFRYCRELVFENAERCDSARLIALAKSQGSLQTILKIHPELIRADFDQFCAAATAAFGGRQREIRFCYRMRLGVK